MSDPNSHFPLWFNITRGIAVTVMALGFGGVLGMAQDFPTPSGNDRDAVTNYLCFTAQCDVLRHPTTNQCICTKLNPGEQRLSHLKLNCQAKQGGQWVACPVPQPYGN